MFSFFLCEKSIISCLLKDNSLILYTSKFITSNNFLSYVNSVIYTSICDFYYQGINVDIPILLDLFNSKNIKIDYYYLVSIYTINCFVSNIKYYLKMLLKYNLANRFRFNLSLLNSFTSNYSFLDVNFIISKLQSSIDLFSSSILSNLHWSSSIDSFANSIFFNLPSSVFNTGFKKLDYIINGIRPGELVIIAGRPSMGKTTFCLDVLRYNSLIKNKLVCFLSLEMSTNQILIKLVSALTLIDSRFILSNTLSSLQIKSILNVCNLLKTAPVYINDNSAFSISDIFIYLKRIKTIFKNRDILVIIDYIQLISTRLNFDNKNNEVSCISSSLKRIAKDLNLPIIIVSQLNRRIEYRTNKIPLMSDLRESGTLEQDADLIIFICPCINPNSSFKNQVSVFVTKNRNGSTGYVNLTFLKSYNCFN